MVQNGTEQDEEKVTPNREQLDETGMSRKEFNVANEKLIEDQLQISEDKL
ncbi:MAG: hypothetical protein K0S39_1072 [Paenibacillus sp.]|jgi:hypothetical protein|nr:hypothetical protein [Paenibacillus sp.]